MSLRRIYLGVALDLQPGDLFRYERDTTWVAATEAYPPRSRVPVEIARLINPPEEES